MWLSALAVAGLGLVLGYVFVKAPLAIPTLAAGAGYFWLSFNRPAWAISAFLFCLVAVPVYLRLPAVGPLPPPPVAITMLLSLGAAAILTRLVNGGPPLWSGRGTVLFVAYAVWGVVMLTSLINERTDAEGVNMWFKAVVFPIAVILILTNGLRGHRDIDLGYKSLLAAAC